MNTMERDLAPQELIESRMQAIVNLGNFEAVFLFTDEGLPLAKATAQESSDEDRLAEMSLTFQNVKNLATSLGGIQRLKEVFIEGENHRKVVFRFFHALGNDLVLAAIIPPKRAYRKVTNDLQRLILTLKF
ncbi:MAG: hypothetical protein Q9P14_19555 [candidate division KSB1 bacterium]|nr:hypothetical protein [candidate division KSB1 bacterium]MDQ7065207.1 hypothetical protein [candidate division KSB1 bacterium]